MPSISNTQGRTGTTVGKKVGKKRRAGRESNILSFKLRTFKFKVASCKLATLKLTDLQEKKLDILCHYNNNLYFINLQV